MLSVQAWCQTDVGLKRENNEDSFLMDPDLGLYIVADGMGGHSGGEVASQMAVQTIRDVVAESFENDSGIRPHDLLAKAYSRASLAIFEKSSADKKLKGMGTTAVTVLIRESRVYFANVGDSRAYLAHDRGMWQMTEDHSLINEQIKSGVAQENDGPLIPKNIITRSVGFEKNISCDVLEREMKVGDKYIICTDGLSGMLEDRDIYRIINESEESQVVPMLIEGAKGHGGLDNVTVLFLNIVS